MNWSRLLGCHHALLMVATWPCCNGPASTGNACTHVGAIEVKQIRVAPGEHENVEPVAVNDLRLSQCHRFECRNLPSTCAPLVAMRMQSPVLLNWSELITCLTRMSFPGMH